MNMAQILNDNLLEKLFWKIYNSDNEDALHKIVQNDRLLSNPLNWKPYGGNENNFGTFESQQSNAVPALVEKVTNSIDALLTKQCSLRGIDPKSKDAPDTMQKAVELFYNIRNGDFSEVLAPDRRAIAEDIQIIATGDISSPNITVYDDGEGQLPSEFVNTFLSLLHGNKTSIQFVQGKYNMGSTGAVVFCGKYRYQLIASKRQDKLIGSNCPNPFGFTLVRRHPLTEEEESTLRSSWYEYFTISDKIPQFFASELDLGLKGRKFSCGSVIKMYSYQLPRGSRSDITLGLWREFNQLLYHPALPFIVYEKREEYKGYNNKLVLGNKTRIFLDEREKKEHDILTFAIDTKELGRVDIEVTVFKSGVKQNEFIGERPVVFTVNGQSQAWLLRKFISQELGFSMLRDFMLIQVDCTNILTSFRQDLLMASRDRLKESENTEILKDKIVQVLRSSETLRDLNQNRKNQLMHESGEDRKVLEKILSNVPIDKDLLNLLKKNGDLSFLKKSGSTYDEHKSNARSDEEKKPRSSKRFPSIFKIDLKQDAVGKKVKSIPINGKGVIKFETDVVDEYLFRPDEKGDLHLQILNLMRSHNNPPHPTPPKPNHVEDVIEVTREGPSDGVIRITFEPKSDLSVGDEMKLSARLTSPSGDLESIFWVKIVEPQKEEKKQERKLDNPALPKLIRVFEKPELPDEKSWQDYNFTGEDVIKIVNSDESGQENLLEGIAVNMDSFVVKRHISRNRIVNQEQIRQVRDKYCMTSYLHALFLYAILDKLSKSDVYKVEYEVADYIRDVLKPYGSVLLSLDTNEAIMSSLVED
jgi:hypothetical protein